ncbi:hypothetical protein B0H13DRAFT_1862143 [Mycena leptocephala]|nr:hypothetical protein B0H13DRAFT_1862143 [Mycena leptocephala]
MQKMNLGTQRRKVAGSGKYVPVHYIEINVLLCLPLEAHGHQTVGAYDIRLEDDQVDIAMQAPQLQQALGMTEFSILPRTAFQLWNGGKFEPDDPHEHIRWRKKGDAPFLPPNAVQEKWTLVGDDKTEPPKGTQDKRKRPKIAEIGRVGTLWDSVDHSCSYDAVFTPMYDIWQGHGPRRSERLQEYGIYGLELVKGFESFHVKTDSLESTRDRVREMLNNNWPDEFPKGPNVMALDDLTHRISGSTNWGGKWRNMKMGSVYIIFTTSLYIGAEPKFVSAVADNLEKHFLNLRDCPKVWPTMLLDPFFHLPNLRDEWDHLGSAHSLEVMSLTSMMQRSLLPNVLNNRARDMMLQLLARLHPTEELDAVLEFIDRSAIVNRVAVHFSMGHIRECQTEMLDVTEKVMLCLLWTLLWTSTGKYQCASHAPVKIFMFFKKVAQFTSLGQDLDAKKYAIHCDLDAKSLTYLVRVTLNIFGATGIWTPKSLTYLVRITLNIFREKRLTAVMVHTFGYQSLIQPEVQGQQTMRIGNIADFMWTLANAATHPR